MTTNYIGAATGVIEVTGDSDWFGIQLQAGTQYLFNVGNGTLSDPLVGIYNSAGQLQEQVSGGGAGGPNNENTQIAFTPTAAGVYYVSAASASGSQTGNYAIQAYTATYDFASNVNTLGAITVGGSVTGTLSSVGQSDWFKVQLTAGKEYVFNISAGTLASTQNQLVSLYDGTGKLILAGNDYEQLSGGQLAYIPTTTGNYFVGVAGNSGAIGSFTLVSTTPSFDFGDTTTTAGSVAVGGSVNGTLTTPQQRDWFAVSLQAGTQYSLTVNGALGSNATVALYDANGNPVIAQVGNGAANGAVQAFTPTASGTYYVEAGALFGATGAFTVSVGTYSGTALPNVNTTGSVAVGGQVSGSIQLAGDADWFKVTLTAGKSYALTLTDGTLGKGTVSLYDSSGNLLTQSNGTLSGLSQTTFSPTTTGSYFVGAAGGPAQTGSYSLAVTTITPDQLGNINTHGTLQVGSTATGSLANVGQSDWFKVSLAAGGHYVFDVNGALGNAQLSLYDASGKLLTQGGSETSYTPAAAGSFYVGVASASTGTGNFTLSAATYSDDYTATTATTGTFTSVAAEIAAYQGGQATTSAIADSLANVQASLDTLQTITAAGKLTTIHLTDAPTPTLTLSAAQLTADSKAVAAIAGGYLLAVSDSAANVAGAFDVLQSFASSGVLSTVTLTDSGTPTLAITAAQLTNDSAVLADITGSYTLVVDTNAAGAAAEANAALPQGIAVSDSGANVLANLAGLQTAATSGKTLTIHLTDSGVPSLSVTETQYAADSNALAAITGSYGLNVSNVLSGDAQQIAGNSHVASLAVVDDGGSVDANLDALGGVATAGKLASVTLTDTGFVSLAVTPTQLLTDASVLNMITGYFTLSINAAAANLTITGLANHGNVVAFTGNANQYTIAPDGNGVSLTVTDSGTGRASVDHLSNVTSLQFADYTDIVAQTPAASSVTTGNITELYGAVFGRLPDVPGLAYYEQVATANPSLTLTTYAQWFLASPEYTGNPAHNYAVNATGDAQFITDSYNNLLHRAPAAGDVAWYQANVINVIIGNATPGSAAYAAADTLAHAFVLTAFSQSAEFLNDVSVTATTPSDSQHWLVLI